MAGFTKESKGGVLVRDLMNFILVPFSTRGKRAFLQVLGSGLFLGKVLNSSLDGGATRQFLCIYNIVARVSHVDSDHPYAYR